MIYTKYSQLTDFSVALSVPVRLQIGEREVGSLIKGGRGPSLLCSQSVETKHVVSPILAQSSLAELVRRY